MENISKYRPEYEKKKKKKTGKLKSNKLNKKIDILESQYVRSQPLRQ